MPHPQVSALQFSIPRTLLPFRKKGIVLTQKRQGSSLAPLKTSFWRIQNRPWCFKMSFAFNPDEGRKITKEGPDPKWILLSSTWFILNVKVQGYKNKWIERGHLWIWKRRHFSMFGGCAQIFVHFLSLLNLKSYWCCGTLHPEWCKKINKWWYRAQNSKEGKERKYGWCYPHVAPGHLIGKPLSSVPNHKPDEVTDWME